MTLRSVVLLPGLLLAALPLALAQHIPSAGELDPYTRRNTFTVFAEYSNDSSHIILGATPNRKLGGVGIDYERRLLRNRVFNLLYDVEFRPAIFSSDVVQNTATTDSQFPGITFTGSNEVQQCSAGTRTYTSAPMGVPPITGVVTTTCTRNITTAQGGSPIGLRLQFLQHRRLQMTLSSNGGYMFSTKPIPIPQAGSFNFTFNFGGGLEYYLAPHRSVRLEYLVQHYSNHYTAVANPGVDSGFVRLGYAFGR